MGTSKRRGWLPGAVALGALVLAVAGWWLFRDLWGGRYVPTEVSQEAAELAEAKLERLRTDGETVSLSAVELSSLLRFRSPQWVAGAVGEPSVAISGDTVILSGSIPTDRLPSHPELNAVRQFLPDSGQAVIRGQVSPRGTGRVTLRVLQVEYAGIPIPGRFYPQVLERIGRVDEPGLAPNAIVVRLPPGVGSARFQDGFLTLTP